MHPKTKTNVTEKEQHGCTAKVDQTDIGRHRDSVICGTVWCILWIRVLIVRFAQQNILWLEVSVDKEATVTKLDRLQELQRKPFYVLEHKPPVLILLGKLVQTLSYSCEGRNFVRFYWWVQ